MSRNKLANCSFELAIPAERRLMNSTQANSAIHPGPVSGIAMDTPLQRRRRVWLPIAGVVLALVVALLVFRGRDLLPNGLEVPLAELRIANAEASEFHDDVVLRAQAVSLTAVMLDSIESGRVEEVVARDGVVVKQGELLFRLSNPQRHLDMLARQSERAQQISNWSILRVSLESGRAEHQRRMSELSYLTAQAEKKHKRSESLAAQGFLSPVQMEESADQLEQQRRLLAEAKRAGATDLAIKEDVVLQMKRAIDGLESGLRLVNATVDALSVRAPAGGRLTDFNLQVGPTVRPDQHMGRIDDPSRFKLTAQVDEFYLTKVAIGRRGSVSVAGRDYAVEVSRVFPQIKKGRFAVELVFVDGQPDSLRPGQSADTRITLGNASNSLVLPNGAFLNDSGGTWAYVVAVDGESAKRRPIRVGRRSNSQVEVLGGVAAGERVIVSSYARFGQSEQLRFVK